MPCVNRFLAQTGSSHPDTGVLEDFAGGSFNVCSKLIVDKVTPSGDQTEFPFSVSGPNDYSDSFELASADTPHDSGQIKSGAYAVSETPGDPNIWNAPSVSCKDQGNSDVTYANGVVNIAPGATVTCTFTNSKRPQLTVIKKIVGGNGTTDSFDVKVDGAAKIDDATSTDPAGTSSGAFPVSAGHACGHRDTGRRLDGGQPIGLGCQLQRRLRLERQPRRPERRVEDLHDHELEVAEADRRQADRGRRRGRFRHLDVNEHDRPRRRRRHRRPAHQRTYPLDTPTSSARRFGERRRYRRRLGRRLQRRLRARTATVSLAYGDAKTCTITNKRKPKLTVVKQIEGGNGAAFDLDVNDTTVLDDVDGTGGQVTNTYPVDTAYVVSETLAQRRPCRPSSLGDDARAGTAPASSPRETTRPAPSPTSASRG